MIVISDPYDYNPTVQNFVKKVATKVYGEKVKIERADDFDDYVEGIDIYIWPNENLKLGTQLKTRYEQRQEMYQLDVHLAYETKLGHKCAFDLYGDYKKLKMFMFIWPKMNYALLVEYKAMMNAWKKNNRQWKKKHTTCLDGCYVSLPLYLFIKNIDGKYLEVNL